MSDENSSVCFVSIYAYAYFATDRDLPTGGAERQLYLLAQELTAEFDIQFIVGDFGQPHRLRQDGVTLHRSYEPSADGPPWVRAKQLLGLLGAMRRANADVYVFRGDRTRAIVVGLLAKILGKQWVYNVALDSQASADSDGSTSLTEFFFGRAIRDANHVIAQTPSQQASLQTSYGVESTIVPNGYPPAEEPISAEQRDFFVYVGRINESQKQTHRFVELARRLPDEEFVLIGPQSDTDAYHERIEQEAAAVDNLQFLGQVDPEAVHKYFRRAIALVNTSTQEGFPNTFLEAWRVSTPIISLNVDPGRFLDGRSLGYADGSFDQLVSLADQLAVSNDYRRQLGEAGRTCFESNYHISATAADYSRVLQTHSK